MSIVIKPIEQGERYQVNMVEFVKQNDSWVAKVEPSFKELTAFHFYKKVQIDNPKMTRHTRAVYNG
jgi:hypothetical protein